MSLPPRLRRHRASLVALVAAAAVAVYVIAAPARADDSKRRELVDAINRLIETIANEVSDVPRDSSASDLERTIDYAGQVYDKADELEDHAGDDARAKKISQQYPSIARRYQDAARYLREMKNQQRRNDEWQRKCEDKNRELAERMRAFTDSPDPRGFDEIPRLARDLGRTGKDALEQAERLRYELASLYDRVDDFSDSDDAWSNVRPALHGAGRSLLEYVQQQQEQLKRDDTCGNLAREERNPRVEEAMRKLSEGKKGIELMYEAMDRQLGEIAGSLDRLEGDSSDSDISSAESKLGDLERNLEQLDRIRGNDSEARRRVEAWRNLVRAAREATKQLRVLKLAQYAADRAPEKCAESTKRLQEIIRGFVDIQDTDGKDEIPLRARAMAEPIKAGLAKTDEQHPIMERALSDAQRFDPSEGRWREVTDRNRASAAAMFDYWKRAREAAHAACDDLAKGDQNPEVIKAVKSISDTLSTNQRDLVQLEAAQRTWYDGIQELKGWYKQDTAAVREMFCTLEESPGDTDDGDAYYAKLGQIADRMRDRLRPRWLLITGEATRLTAQADQLIQKKDKEVQKGAEKVKAQVARVMASLTNLMNNELNGSNDPEIRTKMETGKNEHKRIQSDSSKCTVSELTMGRRRIDCIRVSGSTCYVVEIKPNNRAAQARGEAQIASGMSEIRAAVDGKKKRDELTGKLEVFRPCFDEQKAEINLERELRVYEYCPPDGELFKDFVVP